MASLSFQGAQTLELTYPSRDCRFPENLSLTTWHSDMPSRSPLGFTTGAATSCDQSSVSVQIMLAAPLPIGTTVNATFSDGFTNYNVSSVNTFSGTTEPFAGFTQSDKGLCISYEAIFWIIVIFIVLALLHHHKYLDATPSI